VGHAKLKPALRTIDQAPSGLFIRFQLLTTCGTEKSKFHKCFPIGLCVEVILKEAGSIVKAKQDDAHD
jgi:hypothetical protein